jgi:hypothetical protein
LALLAGAESSFNSGIVFSVSLAIVATILWPRKKPSILPIVGPSV